MGVERDEMMSIEAPSWQEMKCDFDDWLGTQSTEPFSRLAWDTLTHSDMGSLQAKSYGMLSVMHFLYHYFWFFQVQVANTVEHLCYCNNQGLLKCIGFSLILIVPGTLQATAASPRNTIWRVTSSSTSCTNFP
jgi:hypothetical protein